MCENVKVFKKIYTKLCNITTLWRGKKNEMGGNVRGKKEWREIMEQQSFSRMFSWNILGAPEGNKIVVIAEGNSI